MCRHVAGVSDSARDVVQYVTMFYDIDPDSEYMSRKIEILERINSIQGTNGKFDSSNSSKRLGTIYNL